ncbi:MAG TPA: ferritin [Chlamydiales bacterium]|nr:ferritin [Chlamydiales bacterium]
MLSEKMIQTMSEQITKELYSSYLYLQMSAFFDDKNLPGFAHWMRIQSQEEISHGMIFYHYMVEQGALVKLGAIDAPALDYKTALDVFEKVYAHEKEVTKSIYNLMTLAEEERDYATKSRLQWFIDEQVEEESSASGLVESLKLAGNQGSALLMLDKELSQRTFQVPSPLNKGE